jgi:NADPH:quinone reductase-like Zn-dependent oxidoreductase
MKGSPIKPVIDEVLPLNAASLAHRRLEEGKQFGKIVLRKDA